jgi:hypothetical protein
MLAERDNAWTMINEILYQHGCTWNDLPDLLHAGGAMDGRSATRNATGDEGRRPVKPSRGIPLEHLITMLAGHLHLREPD